MLTENQTEREDQLRLLLEAAGLGSWTLHLTSGVLDCSRRCREDFGVVEGEVFTYQTLLTMIHPEDRAQTQDAMDRALREHSDYEAEYRITRPDGRSAWIVARGRAFYNPEGAPERMVGVTLDITERKQQDEARRASDERLIFALSAGGGVGTWDWDVKMDRVYSDARFAALYSVSPEHAAKGAPISDFAACIYPEDRERISEAVARALRTGQEYAEEYRLIQKDNSIRWVYAIGRCHKSQTGEPLRFPGVVFDITERKLAEQQIQESQERLRAIFDGTYEYIGLLTPDGKVLEANRASLEFAPMTREEISGQHFWQVPWFASTPDAPALVEEWVRRAANGEFVRHELSVLHPSGEASTFDMSLHPIRNERGNVVYIVPEGRNITNLKTAELRNEFLVRLDDCTRPLNDADAIVETAARLLCEYLRVDRCVYGEIEPDQETVTVTGGYTAGIPNLTGRFLLNQFGREAAESMLSNRPFAVADTRSDPRIADVREIYQAARIQAFCSTPLFKDGRLVAALAVNHATAREWLSEEVELVERVASRCWESIERARVTRELRQQWHYFDAVLSNSPDLTYTFDLRGRFTYANRGLLSLLQLHFDEVIGKNFFDLNYPDELAEKLQNQIQQVIDSKESLRDQTPFSGPTGEVRQYEYIFVPVLSADGAAEAVAGSTRDITERKQIEEQEHEREEQLRESARLESLGVMAGGIAHDFNNLLTGILGNACLLADKVPDEDGSIARQIVRAAERAADLTRQMLAFSGKGRFVVQSVDLNALVQENLTLLRASLSRTVTVELDLSSERCVVEGDCSQIQQVVMNLLINGSEAIGERPGTVRIRSAITRRVVKLFSPFLQTAVQPGLYVQLEVTDTGCGISSETLKKIFDPFFTTKFTGRGLGLAAVLGIVKGHQGDIEVITKPGAGTTFRVLLPLSEGAASRPEAVEPETLPSATGQTILVVDDEEIVRKVAAAALSRNGFRVLAATHGLEALETLRNNPEISLIILDLTMPLMTGEQAIPLIKDVRPDIPIVLSSGFNEAEIAHRFSSAQISAFLQKPYSVSAILSRVNELLSPLRSN